MTNLAITQPTKTLKPRLSIVIPTYNRCAVLEEALKFIQQQNYKEFEVIIVDNGPSTDNTETVVRSFVQKDERYIYMKTTDKGDFIARNIGCKQAKSDIIVTIDDDWFFTDQDSLQYISDRFVDQPLLGVLGISHDFSKFMQQLEYSNNLFRNIKTRIVRTLYQPGKINRWGRISTRVYYLPFRKLNIVDHVHGFCLAFRHKVALEFDFFPTLYYASRDYGILYRSETELCRQFARRGFEIRLSTEIFGEHKAANRPSGLMPREKSVIKTKYQARNHIIFMLRNYWSRLTAPIFLGFDLLIGNRRQPGLMHLFFNPRYFLDWKTVWASLNGKWLGYKDYIDYYYDLTKTNYR